MSHTSPYLQIFVGYLHHEWDILWMETCASQRDGLGQDSQNRTTLCQSDSNQTEYWLQPVTVQSLILSLASEQPTWKSPPKTTNMPGQLFLSAFSGNDFNVINKLNDLHISWIKAWRYFPKRQYFICFNAHFCWISYSLMWCWATIAHRTALNQILMFWVAVN